MRLITAEKMKDLEAAAAAEGYSYESMMKQAGIGLARIVDQRYATGRVKIVAGLVGGGNNGGDTLVALAELIRLGWQASAILFSEEHSLQGYYDEVTNLGGEIHSLDKEGEQKLEQWIAPSTVILDGVAGTGFQPPIREVTANRLKRVSKHLLGKVIVAVDCPSGVDCVSGAVSPETLDADLTVCMEGVKEGLVKAPAFSSCGEIVTVSLGIPEKVARKYQNQDQVIDFTFAAGLLPKRDPFGNKGSFGRLLVCGGCVNYPGAPNLAAKTAYRAGAGLVEVAIPERIFEIAAANNLESIWTLLEDEGGVIADSAAATLRQKLAKADCLLIGPGLGLEDTTLRFLQRVLFEQRSREAQTGTGFVPGAAPKGVDHKLTFPPLVIDADGLRLLARTEGWQTTLPKTSVLTPHPGEMAALTGLTIEEIQENRLEVTRKYAKDWKQVVVLKGALTVVADPNGTVAVMPFASSALAKAGTGDVLAGLVASLIAQGVSPYKAAIAGVWLHAEAAREVVRKLQGETSLLASDLIEALPMVFARFK